MLSTPYMAPWRSHNFKIQNSGSFLPAFNKLEKAGFLIFLTFFSLNYICTTQSWGGYFNFKISLSLYYIFFCVPKAFSQFFSFLIRTIILLRGSKIIFLLLKTWVQHRGWWEICALCSLVMRNYICF